ncbi:MAG: RNA polymerase sigma factor [Sedimentisphaerales bacterium]|jgi:RNA polymerase sigma-70 factor (ECF subfamily)
MHMHSVFMGHVERLRRLVVGMGLSAEDGDDILQDVYLEVVKRPPEGRSDSEAARWLIRVTVNRCLLEYRRRKRDRRAAKEVLQQWTELEHNAAGPERQAIRAEEIEAIMQCLGEMNESIRMPLAMKYYSGFNANEIGGILGLEPGTVRKRLYDGRIALAKALTQKGIKL